MGFQSKLKLQIVLPADELPDVVAVIMRVARTRRVGDGKLFVVPVEDAISGPTDHGRLAPKVLPLAAAGR